MKTKKNIVLIISICLIMCFITGCSSSKKEATQIMGNYMNYIIEGEFDDAYNLISDFDKGNISEDTFIKWQEQISQIVKIKSFTIDSKIDTLKNYKYLGTEFGTVYGLKIEKKQEILISNIDLDSYNKDTFRIMVMKQDNDYRILFLLTKLDETVATYEAFLKENK